MGKLVCLLGKSSTGKDTLYNLLLADRELALKPLVLYTTRPARAGEEDGREYRFVTEEQLLAFERLFGAIERRLYHTAHGPWAYCTLKDGQMSGGDRICITAPMAIEGYFDAFGAENIFPVYLQTDDSLRLRRAIKREEMQHNPSFSEVCRRYLADDEDFSEEKLALCRIAKRYDNRDLKACFEAVKRDIAGFLHTE